MWLKAPSGNGTKTPLLRSRGSVVSLLLQNRDRERADVRPVLRRLSGGGEAHIIPADEFPRDLSHVMRTQ